MFQIPRLSNQNIYFSSSSHGFDPRISEEIFLEDGVGYLMQIDHLLPILSIKIDDYTSCEHQKIHFRYPKVSKD